MAVPGPAGARRRRCDEVEDAFRGHRLKGEVEDDHGIVRYAERLERHLPIGHAVREDVRVEQALAEIAPQDGIRVCDQHSRSTVEGHDGSPSKTLPVNWTKPYRCGGALQCATAG